jgi:hypothetical protein
MTKNEKSRKIIAEKSLQTLKKYSKIPLAVTLIALKREVAVIYAIAGFPWSECQVRKLATSHCTISYSAFMQKRGSSVIL